VPSTRFVITSRDPVPPDATADGVDGVEIVAPSIDVRPLFHRHAVAAAPSGPAFDIRVSVLEPMAAGVPVVTTSPIGNDLRARAGQDLHASDSRLEFARQVVELLENDGLREKMGAQGRDLVQRDFSWDVVGARLDELLAGVVKGSAAQNGSGPRPAPARREG
jgi:glycosyltransferase involved in cell wall biosynthesis